MRSEIAYREAGEVIFEEVQRPTDEDRPRGPRSLATKAQSAGGCGFPGRTSARAVIGRASEPEPRLFSFNNPFGACPRCQGFGNTVDYDLNLVIPDKGLSLTDGAIDPWNRPKYRPWFTRADASRRRSWAFRWTCRGARCAKRRARLCCAAKAAFEGVHGFFAQMERKKYKLHVRVMLSKYRGYAECPDCRGQRLRAEARAVRINGQNICQACGADDCARRRSSLTR